MDTRIINTCYATPPMQLFVKLANLCLTVTPEEGAPNVPYVMADTNGRMICQVWGESPPTGGCPTYWSLAENHEDVQLWDPEMQGYDDVPGDVPPLYVFKLANFDEFIAKWLVGEA